MSCDPRGKLWNVLLNYLFPKQTILFHIHFSDLFLFDTFFVLPELRYTLILLFFCLVTQFIRGYSGDQVGRHPLNCD